MTSSVRSARVNEIVPLAHRMSYLEAFRAAIAITVLLAVRLWGVRIGGVSDAIRITVLYAGISFIGGLVWRLRRRRGLTMFGGLIIIDGMYLAWAAYVTGGSESPIRYLILLHLVTVTLLASYRTGLKLALWHSLLLLAAFHLEREGLIAAVSGAHGPNTEQSIAFGVVFWAAALLTATFAAVNERELRRRKSDLEALAVMATEMEATTEERAVADVLTRNLRDHFGLQRVAMLRIGGRMLTCWSLAGDDELPVGTFEPQRNSIATHALRGSDALLTSALDPRTDGALIDILPGARNVIIVPMRTEGTAIGLIVAERGGRAGSRIPRREIDMIERFASHGALAIRSAGLLAEIERLASTDVLTMLANRRTFDDVVSNALQRSKQNGRPLALVIADIDNFKHFNDAHGHQAGDEVLRTLGALLRHEVRTVDTVARYGGEEFAIVMPECGAEEATARVDQIRERLAKMQTHHPVTLSFGIAVCPDHAADAEELFALADEALYTSKRRGRNRLTVHKTSNRRLATRARAVEEKHRVA